MFNWRDDFTSFRAVYVSRTPWRNVMHINVTRHGLMWWWISKRTLLFIIWLNIVGSLMEVGAEPARAGLQNCWRRRTDSGCRDGESGRIVFGVGGLSGPFILPVMPMGPLFWRIISAP